MNTEFSLEPRQRRSRATVERLLNATITILDNAGLEGAVIPRIAKEAGMVPANVYRRFIDKDALLRAAFLHALSESNQHNPSLLAQSLPGATLAISAEQLVKLLFEQYRRHPRFLRALSRFIETDTNQEFVSKARTLIGSNLDHMICALLVHQDEIRHAEPKSALRFAILNITCSIEAFALDAQSIWHVAPAVSDGELATRLVDSFVAYLQHG